MSMEAYRLFIAAELPPPIQQALAAVQQRLQRESHPVRWVAPDSIHLTLHFLGDTDTRLLPRLGAALRAALASHSPLTLHLAPIGAFPNTRRPNVVWAGAGGDTAALEGVYAATGAALEALGLPREARPFHPHLTLGRVRREAGPDQRERLGQALRALPPLDAIAWPVERVALFRSELGPGGPVYTLLETAQLKR